MNEKVDFLENWEHDDRFISGLINVFFLEVSQVGKGFEINGNFFHRLKSTEKWPETCVETTVGSKVKLGYACEIQSDKLL